jgi:hypothetical protein
VPFSKFGASQEAKFAESLEGVPTDSSSVTLHSHGIRQTAHEIVTRLS